MTKLKVMTVLGTRPEIIRLSRVIARLETLCDHRLVHTGQNWDPALSGRFFDELGLRQPDAMLGVDPSSLASVLGGVLIGVEKLIKADRPDAMLVLGDTNSAIAALIARRMKVPVYHMEAGNRSFDRNVPEETNRKLVDHLADFNLVYTEHARRHLLSEGLPHRRIVLTGSPMAEVLDHYRSAIEGSDVLERLGLERGGYYIVSLHREENVDSAERLGALTATLARLAERDGRPVIVSTHPRTRQRLDRFGAAAHEKVRWLEPFGFFDYNALQMGAACAISDSGTIAEEATLLGFAAITPRDSIERPEAIDSGGIIACGLDGDSVLGALDAAMAFHAEAQAAGTLGHLLPADYRIANTSERVAKLILGTARLSNGWDGIRMHDHDG